MHVGTGLASEQRLWWQWKVSGRYREEPVTESGREKKEGLAGCIFGDRKGRLRVTEFLTVGVEAGR